MYRNGEMTLLFLGTHPFGAIYYKINLSSTFLPRPSKQTSQWLAGNWQTKHFLIVQLFMDSFLNMLRSNLTLTAI